MYFAICTQANSTHDFISIGRNVVKEQEEGNEEEEEAAAATILKIDHSLFFFVALFLNICLFQPSLTICCLEMFACRDTTE